MLKSVTLAALVACALPARALAQVDAQIGDLNRQALDSYQALDIDGARTKLERAIKLAQRSNHSGPTVAQSYLALGLVYVAGANDNEQGLAAFVHAICMQRDVQLDPLLSTPAVKQVFAQAQKDAQAGACGPASAAPSATPAPPTSQTQPDLDLTVPDDGSYAQADADAECPPGMRCGGRGGDEWDEDKPSDFARFFLNVQLTGGFSLLRSGMEAASPPPALVSTPMSPTDVFVPDGTDPVSGMERRIFNPASPWVPDADSFDDFEDVVRGIPRGVTALSTNCAADGEPSGPLGVPDKDGNPYATMTPSKYCVRVATPGLVPALALRANLGYFITESLAISIPFRFQFVAGEGAFANMLLGLRGELMFSRFRKPTGTAFSWFFGANYGQIQARPKAPSGSTVEGPFAKSGPFGFHTGMNVRIRLHRNFGLIISPELDVLIPALLFHADVSAGVETSF
jgi:hypothetical protein